MIFDFNGFLPKKFFMMKYILILFTSSLPFFSIGQRLHADFYGGVANYQGDLQGRIFTFNKSGIAGSIGLSYDITNNFRVRGLASFASIQGNDKYNTTNKGVEVRNLNFKTNIVEGQVALEFNLLDLSKWGFTPYVFAGGAIYNFNPYTFDSAGKKVFLQPLGTEGQGLSQYPNKKQYKLTQFAIPFGAGLKLALTGNLQLGFEFGFRKLFHDYLDDVSTTYADSSILAAARGTQSVALAYRGDELPGGLSYPAEGAQRGNSKLMDWYYMTGIRVSYLLGTGNRGGGGGGGRRRTKTGCPTNVY